MNQFESDYLKRVKTEAKMQRESNISILMNTFCRKSSTNKTNDATNPPTTETRESAVSKSTDLY